MADIELTLGGNADGATQALNETGQATKDVASETGKATVQWALMADVVMKAAVAVVKWGTDAVKMYAESTRLQAQLNRAAGEYGEVLGKQAEALSKVYAVDDDVIKQSYTLITQWGGAGAATEETTKAVLNYAAATGKDAVAATQELIRNVESGGVGLAKMGIHFKETGKRGDDLTAAVAAINAQLGGAAEGDANSLVGTTRAASLAFDDLKKSVGGMLAKLLDESGALSFITMRLRELKVVAEVLAAVLPKLPGFLGGVVRGNIDVSTAADEIEQTANAALLGAMGADNQTAGALPAVANVATNKGAKDAGGSRKSAADLAAENLAARKAEYEGIEILALRAAQQEEDQYAAELERSAKRVELAMKEGEDITAAMQLSIAKDLEAEEKRAKEADKLEEKQIKDSMDRARQKATAAAQAGDVIGAAFVNALGDQLSKLAAGEEFDVALFVGDILASVIAVAGTVIGTAYGQPALGAAVGNLAAMGVRAGAGAVSASNKKGRAKTYHSGGWVEGGVDLPRYHSGSWIGSDERPAILQTDERVASRQEVKNAGGRDALDAVLKGQGRAPAINVSIMAIDSKNAAESFMTDLGRGLRDALRSGHGDVPVLLGGPR